MSRLRALRESGDRGVTLVETLAAIVVGTVVMGAATTMFVAALNANKTTTERVDTINAGRVSAAAIGKSLRTAIRPSQLGSPSTEPALLAATATSLQFYANLENADETVGPSRVTYDVTTQTVGGTAVQVLVQKVQRPTTPVNAMAGFAYCDDTLASCPVTRTVLATNVNPATSFTYYNTDGSQLPLVGGTLPAASRELVNSVDVKVVVGATRPSTYLTRVQLTNQDAYRGGKQ